MRIDNRTLQTVLAALRSQSDSCFVRPTDRGGWQLWCMRPDGATMVNMVMAPEAFDTVEGTPDVFVLDIDRWTKALRTLKAQADVEFLDGRVRLSGDGMRHTFRLDAVDPTLKIFRSKDLSSLMTSEAMLETERIRSFLGVVDIKRTNDLRVSVSSQGLSLQAYDDSLNGVDLTVPPEDCALLEGEARAMFSCEAWQEIFKVMPQDAVVDIRLGDDKPVVVGFGDKLYEGSWMSAPYIETE